MAFWEKQWPHKFILNLTDMEYKIDFRICTSKLVLNSKNINYILISKIVNIVFVSIKNFTFFKNGKIWQQVCTTFLFCGFYPNLDPVKNLPKLFQKNFIFSSDTPKYQRNLLQKWLNQKIKALYSVKKPLKLQISII